MHPMKAYEIGDYASSGKERLVERPDPVPGPREALVRKGALRLNVIRILELI